MRKTATLLSSFLALSVILALQAPPLMAEQWDAVADGSFELGSPNPVWNEYSEHTGVVIQQGIALAHTGDWYASFGSDYPTPDNAWLEQEILLGEEEAVISFWWTRPFESENDEDTIELFVDGAPIWLDRPYPGIGPLEVWIEETIDISSFADGDAHTIRFNMTSTGTSPTGFGTLWFVDDVQVMTRDSADLQADFYWTPNNPMVGEIVQFWDTTTGGADEWFWDFGDGQTSTLKDPVHVFDNAGQRQVTLIATRSWDSEESDVTHIVDVGNEPLSVDFSWQPIEPIAGETVTFFPDVTGGPDDWDWDFGDSNGSELMNPVHAYDEPGEYVVVLEIYRSFDEASDSIEHVITVLDPLIPDFDWTPEVPGSGEVVSLTDDSTGDPDSWLWDFGDDQSSVEQHPTHAWNATGDYPVTLTISRSGGDPVDVTHCVTVSDDEMTAAFSWAPFEPEAGEPVEFSDSSTGEPDLWLWQFGAGQTSDEQDPTHTFEIPGEFVVSLTVSRSNNPTVTSTTLRTVTVLGPPLTAWFEWAPPAPAAGATVEFIDLSQGDPVAWEWDFDDNSTSTEQFPSHAYTDAGTYEVTLTITNSIGTAADVTRQLSVSDDPYLAHFSWIPEEPHAGQAVEFLDLSHGAPVAWHWDFGDGRTSIQQHPVHWFDAAGEFDVTLSVAFDPNGTILRSTTQTVEIGDPPLEADFFWIPLVPTAGETVDFSDASRGRPTSWFWGFGDGQTSDAQHPAHAYQAPGEYTVSLMVERDDGKALSTDTRTRIIRVTSDIEIDFSWDPLEPRALEQVQFTEDIEDIEDPIGGRFWAFGDSETSDAENPEHIYRQPGNYLVQLWVTDVHGDVMAAAEHEIVVLPPDLDISLVVSNADPDIGETVTFQLEGINAVEGVMWAFGGLGCDGSAGDATCVPTDTDDCLTATYTYASAGLKPARAWIRVSGDLELGPFSSAVRVNPEGLCTSMPQADFNWWPAEPKAGQQVRCVDLSVGPPDSWAWTFDDGSTSTTQHTPHVFEIVGEHIVELAIANDHGQSTVTKTISVGATDAVCGSGACEPGESSWSCPQDCLDDPEGTGRAGRKHTNLVIPAAVGGSHGANGTYWVTEGSIVNPGEEDAQVVVEFVADNDPDNPRVAGPATIPPRSAIRFDNVVEELFGTHASGSLWVDADQPVIANTRTFNATGAATFGQGIGGITKNDVLGAGDGSVYIVGLKQTKSFRSNFLFQEVSGNDATVEAQIFDATGTLVASGSIDVPARTKWQKPITLLGITTLKAGYAMLSVNGDGKIAAMASVIDQVTGDATSLDSVHSFQTAPGTHAKADGDDEEDSHFLVAVIARTPGANDTVWRSEVSILNPEETDQVLELRYLPSGGDMLIATRELASGELFFSEDVVDEIFPEAADGAGSLHVFAQKGLVVNSRTYNVLPDESTAGQAIPGLATGDMARPGEIWLLDSLKQTQDFRCNLGFAEYEGSDAEVTVVLFDTDGASLFFLASKKYTVPAFEQLQVNKVFQNMGLSGQFREAIAYVSVASEGGALYIYASVVDNAQGDGTTILGKRQ